LDGRVKKGKEKDTAESKLSDREGGRVHLVFMRKRGAGLGNENKNYKNNRDARNTRLAKKKDRSAATDPEGR